jgi:hypothetical protein
MLLVRSDSPFKSVADVLAGARQRPGYLSYGHAGNGTSPHLAGELLKYLAKVEIAAIPYKGGAPSLNDLIGGHVPLTFNNIPESIAQVRAGAVRPLGVTTAARSPALPDVPTIAEAGVPGYDTGVWWGFLAPARLPADVKAALRNGTPAADIAITFNVTAGPNVGQTATMNTDAGGHATFTWLVAVGSALLYAPLTITFIVIWNIKIGFMELGLMAGSAASCTLKEEACGVASSVNRRASVAHPVPAAEMN